MSERAIGIYQRYPLIIEETRVTVFTPEGRKIGVTTNVPKARALVKGYRKAIP